MALETPEARLEAENAAADSLVADSGPMVHFADTAYEPVDLDEAIGEWNEGHGYHPETYKPKYLAPEDDPNLSTRRDEGEHDEEWALNSLAGEEQEQAESEGQESQETEPEEQDLQFGNMQELIQHYELADPDAAEELVMELTNGEAATSSENIDADAMSATLSEVALSSAQAYDQLSAQVGDNIAALPNVPAEQAQRFANEFISSWGYDPQQVPHNPQILANVVFRGAYNQVRTWAEAGKPEDFSGLNEPEASQMFIAGLMSAFGQDVSPEQINPQYAVAFCDKAAKVILGSVSKSVSLANQRRANPVRQGMREYNKRHGRG